MIFLPFTPSPTRMLLENLKARDPLVYTHGCRVGRMAVRMGAFMGLSRAGLELLEAAARLHDYGKLALPPFLVHHDGCFSHESRRVMERHARLGGLILEEHRQASVLAQVAYSHHERWDGEGYPHGLKGAAIPLFAQITAVADAYDAMTAERSYRDPVGHDEALEEIRSCRGTHFSPDAVDAFLETDPALALTEVG